jgi:hypothetical protein
LAANSNRAVGIIPAQTQLSTGLVSILWTPVSAEKFPEKKYFPKELLINCHPKV